MKKKGVKMEVTAEDRRNVIKEMMSANKKHRHLIENALNGCKVYRGQHQLLMFVARNEGKSQKEIARGLGVTTATVAVAIKKLQKEGYIKKTMDKADNRYNQIMLTKKGNEMVVKSCKLFEQVDEEMLRGFTMEELELLLSLFKRMNDNMEHAVIHPILLDEKKERKGESTVETIL